MTDFENIDKSEFFKCNPFQKGFISDEDRKKPIIWRSIIFVFFCKHADLLGAPVEVKLISNYKFINYKDEFMRDYMEFIFWWKDNIFSHLNGFSGIDCIKFEFDKNININFLTN